MAKIALFALASAIMGTAMGFSPSTPARAGRAPPAVCRLRG